MIANWVKDYNETKNTVHFDNTINNIVEDIERISPIYDTNELNILRFNLHHVDKFVETTFMTYAIDHFANKFKFKMPRLKINLFQNAFSKLDVAE